MENQEKPKEVDVEKEKDLSTTSISPEGGFVRVPEEEEEIRKGNLETDNWRKQK